jgi:hypothetical protein
MPEAVDVNNGLVLRADKGRAAALSEVSRVPQISCLAWA